MIFLWLKCLSCSEELEVPCDGDNPLMCPECRDIDNFEEIEEENKSINSNKECSMNLFDEVKLTRISNKVTEAGGEKLELFKKNMLNPSQLTVKESIALFKEHFGLTEEESIFLLTWSKSKLDEQSHGVENRNAIQ